MNSVKHLFQKKNRGMGRILLAAVLCLLLTLSCLSQPVYAEQYTAVDGSRASQSVHINNTDTHPFVLNTPIQNCKKLQVTISVDMKAGSRCKDWKVYASSSSSGNNFVPIGDLYLARGTGDAETTVYLSSPMTVWRVAVVPKKAGSYSWSMAIDVGSYGGTSAAPRSEAPSSSSSSGNYVSGHWGNETVYMGDAQGQPYVLDNPIRNCKKLKIGIDVDLDYGARCKYWTVYANDSYGWDYIGEIYLPGGIGETEETLYLSSSMDVESLLVVPKVQGSYSGSISISVYTLGGTSPKSNAMPRSSGSETWVDGSWSSQTVTIGNFYSYTYDLNTPIYNCRKLKVSVDITMKYGSRVKDWYVYASESGSDYDFEEIGSFYLPSGTGSTEAIIYLDAPMTIRSVTVLPKKYGSYSWSTALGVYDCN